ncbi:hypothetical protein PSEUBRA_006159 [Kalmanozyma brasiliensis GHG001]|uniref:uncharacterized protein n=1 Tax=Kalmanozyma brasiliensis (strain GHG001) TaxID=1365824 RepID=UPI001CE91415|nr:uncharacterized protein PSEUBRA_006159 [Kalmanozyma brasiliensis GHG001]KAF6767632.1 hypothetical protein PSEUBRA_006159 [Kalmanozyma brasiliensis GHG001]
MMTYIPFTVFSYALLVSFVAWSAAMDPNSPTIPSVRMDPIREQSAYRSQPVGPQLDTPGADIPSSSALPSPRTRFGATFDAGASSSLRNSIPAFHDESGLQWGPYNLHREKFQPKEYPLWMHELTNLYTQDGTRPAELENSNRRIWPGVPSRLSADPFVYRPEPEMLESIATTIKRVLHARDVRLQTPLPQRDKYFYHGMFLWPPVRRTARGLAINARTLDTKYKRVIYNRLRANRFASGFFRLAIPSTSEAQPRSVLITMSDPKPFTTVDVRMPKNSLWMFYEPRLFDRRVGGQMTTRKGDIADVRDDQHIVKEVRL